MWCCGASKTLQAEQLLPKVLQGVTKRVHTWPRLAWCAPLMNSSKEARLLVLAYACTSSESTCATPLYLSTALLPSGISFSNSALSQTITLAAERAHILQLQHSGTARQECSRLNSARH